MCTFRITDGLDEPRDHELEIEKWRIKKYDHYTDSSGKLKFVACQKDGCSYKTSNKSNFRRHQKTLHTNNAEKFVCTQCDDKIYSSKYTLKQHIRAVHEGFLLTCERCDQKFTTRSGLSEHKRAVHDSHYRHECELCGKGFLSKCHYLSHINSHYGNKMFVCQSCGKQFAHNSGLKEHVRKAHGENETGFVDENSIKPFIK